MTKAELEHHWSAYHAALTEAQNAIALGDYKQAIENVVSSWEHIDGMIQYERKNSGTESVSIDTINIILQFAPLLFEYEILDRLEVLLKAQRRIEKNSSLNLSDLQAKARHSMYVAHRLWNHLEQSPAIESELCKQLEVNLEELHCIVAIWQKMGLVARLPEGNSYRVSLCSRMNQDTMAKCVSCGAVAKAHKSLFLDQVTCPRCHSATSFVLLADGALSK
jgi:hypothetical protein